MTSELKMIQYGFLCKINAFINHWVISYLREERTRSRFAWKSFKFQSEFSPVYVSLISCHCPFVHDELCSPEARWVSFIHWNIFTICFHNSGINHFNCWTISWDIWWLSMCQRLTIINGKINLHRLPSAISRTKKKMVHVWLNLLCCPFDLLEHH